jgi:hypothetical protein
VAALSASARVIRKTIFGKEWMVFLKKRKDYDEENEEERKRRGRALRSTGRTAASF